MLVFHMLFLEAFRNFLFSDTISSQEVKEVIKTYDSDISWYRWKVTISAKDLSKQVEPLLFHRFLLLLKLTFHFLMNYYKPDNLHYHPHEHHKHYNGLQLNII